MSLFTEAMMNLIVSCFPFGRNAAVPERINSSGLKTLYAISVKHDIAHIVASALEKNNLFGDDIESRKAFEKQKLLAVFRREQINKEEAHICKILEDAEIDHLPLKGAVIRKYYPEEWMRTSCDIDILVKPDDLDRAIGLIIDKLHYSDLGRDFHDHHLRSPNGVHLELHFSVAEKDEKADAVLKRVWEYSSPKENRSYRYEMTNEFLMFYSVAHAKFHFVSGGCGIRQILDLWVMQNCIGYDETKLKLLSEEAGMEMFRKGINELISVWFEGKEHNELTQQMEKYILSGGTFGTKSNAASTGQAQKGGKGRYILSRIFMPKSDLQVKYPKLKKHPILLPYYEICRWFSFVRKKGFSDAKSEISVKSREDTAKMLKELGI